MTSHNVVERSATSQAPRGAKARVTWASGAAKRRTTIYFDEATADALAAWCAAERYPLSEVVEAAVRAYLDARWPR